MRCLTFVNFAGLFHRVGCYCSMSSQQSITKCAQPLYDIGAFGANKNSQTFTWEIFSKKTREDFIRVCEYGIRTIFKLA